MPEPVRRSTRASHGRLRVHDPEVTRALAVSLGMRHLVGHPSERMIWAVFTFINSFLTIALLSGLAMVSKTPFVFPSLGPTAFLFFFTPRAPAASPRHAVYGHAIGLLCGYGALAMFGLRHAPTAMHGAVDLHRLFAVALSLSMTGALMILLKAVHPPAGATTLIVSLGIVTDVFHLFVIEVAVVLLTAQALLINRLAGLNYPSWALREPEP